MILGSTCVTCIHFLFGVSPAGKVRSSEEYIVPEVTLYFCDMDLQMNFQSTSILKSKRSNNLY